MNDHTDEPWRFTARPGEAEKVYLVIDSPTAASRWIEMATHESDPGVWTLTTRIDPTTNRMRYFTMNAGAYLNCGNVGLHAQRSYEHERVA